MGVQVAQLTKKRENFTLGSIDFEIPAGYILGVVGRNGSGKSTLFQSMLFGECRNGGAITLHGMAGGSDGEAREEYRRQCAFVLEKFPFTDTLNARDIGELYGPLYRGFCMEKYRELLKQFSIPEKKLVKKLSSGMKLMVQIALAFSHDSKVLFLDEPTASLDSFARKDLYKLIGEYMESGDRNVIWTTHLTEELDRMADYLLVLENGKQSMFGEKEAVLSNYRVVKGSKPELDGLEGKLLGRMDRENYSEGLIRAEDTQMLEIESMELPDIEQLLIYLYGIKRDSNRREKG